MSSLTDQNSNSVYTGSIIVLITLIQTLHNMHPLFMQYVTLKARSTLNVRVVMGRAQIQTHHAQLSVNLAVAV